MGVRSLEKGTVAVKDIQKLYPQAKISLLQIDHLSLDSVVAAAKLVISKEPALHGLINNAGIMATPFRISKDGYEEQWQTNYLAHWVLTAHLLPLLLATSKTAGPGSARIVNLTSSGHWSTASGGIDFSDLSLPNDSPRTRYGQSKLANVLHTRVLHEQYGPGSANAKAENGEVWVCSVHPGLVETNLANNSEFTGFLKWSIATLRFLGAMADADKGGWTSVYCAASPDMKKTDSGAYYQRMADSGGWRSFAAKDPALAKKLDVWTNEEMKKRGWSP